MKKRLPAKGTIKRRINELQKKSKAPLLGMLLLTLAHFGFAQCFTQGVTPTAGNDAGFNTCYGSKITIPFGQLLANDVEPTGGSLTINSFSNPSGIDVKQVGNSFEIDPKNSSGYITFTYTVKKDDGFLPFNGRFYKSFPASNNITWQQAKNVASQQSYFGRAGYLPTINNKQENDFLKANFPIEFFTGGSTENAPGHAAYNWVTGPEGLQNGGNGASIIYTNWAPLYLPEYGKDRYIISKDGFWTGKKDYKISGSQLLVEFGGMETSCVAEVFATATVTIYVSPQLNLSVTTAGTCQGGNIGAATIFTNGGTQPYSYDHFNYSFSGNTIDPAVFNIRNGSYSCSNALVAQSLNNYSLYQNSISTRSAYADMGFLRLEGCFKLEDNANVLFGLTPANVQLNNVFTMPVSINFNNGFISTIIAGSSTNSGSYVPGVWYDVKIEKKGTAVSFFSRKAGEVYWTLIASGNYNGTEGAYAVASQYYADMVSHRGYTSKNWKLSFNPETTNLNKGNYTYTVIDALGCMATRTVSVNDNINFSVQSALTHTTALNACNGAIELTTGVNTIASITTNSFTSDFNNGYNATNYNTVGSFFSPNGSELKGNRATDQSLWKNSAVTNKAFTDNGYLVFAGSAKFESNNRAYLGFATTQRAINNENDIVIGFSYKNGTLFYNINGVPMPLGAYAAGTWWDFKIEKVGSLVKFFVRKGSDDFKMVGMETYYGGETQFRFGMQYFGQNGSFGTVLTKNWVVTEKAQMNNLCAGSYTYSVTSEGGCTTDANFTIFDPVTIVAAVPTAAVCFGNSDGKITVTAQGGKPNYQYSVNGASFSSNNVISNLAAGTYNVVVRDNLGSVSAPMNVEVTQPAKIKAEITASSALDICVGQSITLNAVTDIAAPIFKWGGSSSSSTQSILTNKAGAYNVRVSDANGCSSTSENITLNVHQLPVTSMTFNPEANPCVGFTMTGQTSTIENTYEWTYGATNPVSKGVGKSLNLRSSDADGLYSVYAVNPYGCRSALPATYNYVNKNLEVSYTIVGIKQVTINEGAVVTSGSIGVVGASGKATFQKNTSVAGAGAFVKAKSISVGKPVNIPSQIKVQPALTLPDMLYNTSVVTGSNIQQKVDGVLHGNHKDVTIKNGSRVIITGSVFGKVQIEDNCEVTFTSTNLSMDELTVKNNNDPTPTVVHFSPDTDLKIRGNVLIEQNCKFNPEEVRLNVFVGTLSGNALTFEVKGYGTDVRASVYVPVGQIKITTDDVHGASMKGLYIGETVMSSGKKAVWSAYTCSEGQLAYSRSANPFVLPTAAEAGTMKASVYPNPTSSSFNLKVTTTTKEPVVVTIVDISGRIIERTNYVSGLGNITLGATLKPGAYFAQVVQGGQKQIVKLIKL